MASNGLSSPFNNRGQLFKTPAPKVVDHTKLLNRAYNDLVAANKYVAFVSRSHEVQARCQGRSTVLAVLDPKLDRHRNGITTDADRSAPMHNVAMSLLEDMPTEAEHLRAFPAKRGFFSEMKEQLGLYRRKGLIRDVRSAANLTRPTIHKVRTLGL